jgi:LmbE family N-acetylglucosaminyl deacetylase
MNFQELLSGPRPVPLSSCSIPHDIRLLVLAPHPDDFDEIGVTLRFFRDNGNPIFVAVVSSGAGGVEDSFCTPPTIEKKAAVRELEQRRSCRFFGLRDTHLDFLRLTEDHNGHIPGDSESLEQIRRCVNTIRPAMVFLPHGNDTNACHRHTSSLFMHVASEAGYPLAAFLNKDPKTISMRYDFYTPFGVAEAEWKAILLRFHTSQQQRNLNTRGMGFDERILEVNRQIARECPGNQGFAEVFEFVCWD